MAGIGGDGAAVGEDAHGCKSGENGAVYEARRGEETEPPVYDDEDGGGIDVGDGQNDEAHRQRPAETTQVLGFLGHRKGAEAPAFSAKRRRLREKKRERDE